jgi:hypothetical protein
MPQRRAGRAALRKGSHLALLRGIHRKSPPEHSSRISCLTLKCHTLTACRMEPINARIPVPKVWPATRKGNPVKSTTGNSKPNTGGVVTRCTLVSARCMSGALTCTKDHLKSPVPNHMVVLSLSELAAFGATKGHRLSLLSRGTKELLYVES